MSKPDGGTAFPLYADQSAVKAEYAYNHVINSGMSLRDYFAAQAIATAHSELTRQMGEGELAAFGWNTVSRIAYRIADAMLAERTK